MDVLLDALGYQARQPHQEDVSTSSTDAHKELLAGDHAQRRRLMVLPGYTDGMKTAISVPDDIFEQATRRAAELGISRSEFFARAARRYLDELASRSLTQQVNDALQAAGNDDSAAAAAHVGHELLAAGEDW
jgi:Arc/MetJ family transcription regulator